ncbi:MAG: hypothetical protein ACI8YQ_003840 [Polaribacter sp.]|jgi:hypothetical protein
MRLSNRTNFPLSLRVSSVYPQLVEGNRSESKNKGQKQSVDFSTHLRFVQNYSKSPCEKRAYLASSRLKFARNDRVSVFLQKK